LFGDRLILSPRSLSPTCLSLSLTRLRLCLHQTRNPTHAGHAYLMRTAREILLKKGYSNPVSSQYTHLSTDTNTRTHLHLLRRSSSPPRCTPAAVLRGGISDPAFPPTHTSHLTTHTPPLHPCPMPDALSQQQVLWLSPLGGWTKSDDVPLDVRVKQVRVPALHIVPLLLIPFFR